LAHGGWGLRLYCHFYGTRDGGAAWTKTALADAPHLWDIAALPNGVVLVCGEKGVLYRKGKNSEAWQKIALNNTDAFWNPHVQDDDHVWLCCYYGVLFFSNDRGKIWVSRLKTPRTVCMGSLLSLPRRGGWPVKTDGSFTRAMAAQRSKSSIRICRPIINPAISSWPIACTDASSRSAV